MFSTNAFYSYACKRCHKKVFKINTYFYERKYFLIDDKINLQTNNIYITPLERT